MQKQRERKHGIDVYSLAIGESTESLANAAKKSDDVSNFIMRLRKRKFVLIKNSKVLHRHTQA